MGSLGDRMKLYEKAARTVLPPRMPIVVRVDGKAFHTWTRGCEEPFDGRLIGVMNAVAVHLCKEIQGAQLAYVQSDEVSVLVHGYKRFNSQAWFDGEVQKIVSVSAAVAAATCTLASVSIFGEARAAYFDSRVFVLPEAEVCNYFVWRQQDAVRNSVQMLARSLFSHKACDRKNCDALKAMCLEAGHDWAKLPAHRRRGRCVRRVPDEDGLRSRWLVETPPIFAEDRGYVERHLALEES